MARFHTIALITSASLLLLQITSGAFPELVTVSIQNDDEIISLNWKQTGKFFANENLPLWSTRMNSNPQLIPNVMQQLGPYSMYHDVEKSSAVVYFAKSNSFFGVIDSRFYIEGLPLNKITPGDHHKVDELYVKRRVQDGSKSFHDDLPSVHVPSSIPTMNLNYIHSMFDQIISSKVSSSSTDPSNNQRPKDILYPEILVLVTEDIVKRYMAEAHGLVSLVMYYLVNLNAVDMLYAKLAKDGIVIHINIAGMILEMEPATLPILSFITPEDNQYDIALDSLRTLAETQNYLRRFNHVFVEDSYDFFFVSTSYPLLRDELQLKGIALAELRVYVDRVDGFHDPLGLLVEQQPFYADYITITHELAHGMGLQHDSESYGRQREDIQCFAILQQFGSFCRNCLVWSEKSRKEFGDYIRTNPNHCFLLNEPRSLHPHGTIILTIGPHQQCVCYGFQTHISNPLYLDTIGTNECETEIACSNDGVNANEVPAPLPIDGTPCELDRVCWQKQCQKLSPREEFKNKCTKR